MTNREKYIDNLSNKELATKLAYREICSMCIRTQQGINPTECNMYGANCEELIEEWLSQELAADEMFEELGYKKNPSKYYDNGFSYSKKLKNEYGCECVDTINIPNAYCFCKYRHIIAKKSNSDISYIYEDEHKAILQKIKEMKGG